MEDYRYTEHGMFTPSGVDDYHGFLSDLNREMQVAYPFSEDSSGNDNKMRRLKALNVGAATYIDDMKKRRTWPPNDTVLTTRAEWTH